MKVLVLAAHPDDETFGCGGVLLRHIEAGNQVHWAIMTRAHHPQWSEQAVQQQARQVEVVVSAYPMASLDWYEFPSTRLDAVPMVDLINRIRQTVEWVRPEVVYIPNRSDVHTDHRITFDAALSVLKPFHMTGWGVKRVLAFETLSSTEAAPQLPSGGFMPTVFADITLFIERKLEIGSLFGSEVQPEPMPRSLSAVRALARVRGATVAVEYAEAFMLIREIT